MARRRTAKKPRRRTVKPMIKVIPAVAGLVSASALTSMFFGNNLRDFLVNTSGDGSQRITLRELFNLGGITNYGIGGGTLKIGQYVRKNIEANWMMAAGTLIAAKAVPKIMTKVGITRQANQLSKSIGLGSIVQL
jgi:hypothetical protein